MRIRGRPGSSLQKWCIMAAQKDAQGDSLVAFTVKAITEEDDAYFKQWVEQQLNATMGAWPTQETCMRAALAAQSPLVPAQFAAELSKGLALGLKLLGPLKPPTLSQGGHADMETKQGYSNEDIATLMGFAQVKHGSQLPTIWEYFISYRGKSIDICRRQLIAWMKQWSHDRRIPIKLRVYLEGTIIKALVNLKFNPGEGVAHLSFAGKGLSIMYCQGRTSTKTGRILKHEDTMSAMENMHQLDKLLRMFKGVTRAPADDFWELKINMATFMSLAWVLFGSECHYYKGLCNTYGVLNLKEVMAQKQAFLAEHCHRIMWAIINNGRAYFKNIENHLGLPWTR
jgi:hypothetical protein